MSVFEKIKAGYQQVKELIAQFVLEAERELKGKTGKQKREWVAKRIADAITLPWWGEALKLDYWGAKILIGQVCDRFNLLTDGDFSDVEIDPALGAAVADIPEIAILAARATLPMSDGESKQQTVDERFRALLAEYGLKPPTPEESKPVTGKAASSAAPADNSKKWNDIVSFILAWEGGYVNDPDDPGGKTNRGITEATLAAAYAQGIVKHCDIAKVTREDAAAIYKARYYDSYGYGALPFPVALALTDATVNSGRGGVAWIAQRACVSLGLAIAIDGKWGPKTQAAVETLAARMPEQFARMLLVKRKNFYDDLIRSKPVREKYRNGWYNRLRALAKTIGVPSPV